MTEDVKLKRPWVSIGMPVYNGEEYLREAVESALRQTYPNFEVIIADNASNDTTQQICEEFAARDNRIRYIRHPANLGPMANFAFVAQEAKYPLFTWLAHDDTLEPSFLEEAVERLDQNPNLVLVATDFRITDPTGKTLWVESLGKTRETLAWKSRCINFFRYYSFAEHICIYGVIRSDAARKAFQSIPKTRFLHGMETPFLARIATMGEIASIPSVLRIIRMHEKSNYATELAGLAKMRRLRARFEMFLHESHLTYDQTKVLLTSSLPLNFKLPFLARRVKDMTFVPAFGLLKRGIKRAFLAVGVNLSRAKA